MSKAQRLDGGAVTVDPAALSRVLSGDFAMGSDRHYAEEAPVRAVTVAPFRMDRSPVTNRQFAAFVKATGHVTVAERAPDPAAYPGVDPRRLKPGALVFTAPSRSTTNDWRAWWRYTPGATWLKPEGRGSVFRGRLDHPVVCVAFEDAQAYADWAGKHLPTEAEWEFAARGGLDGAVYAWGDARHPHGRRMANTWEGRFPDGGRQVRTSAVGDYPPNAFGLNDMMGNVWEWTTGYFTGAGPRTSCCAPPGVEDSYDPDLPDVRIPRRVVKGGSHLCHEDYCDRYRPAARQPQMEDTASTHIGFRCVVRS